MTIQSNSSAASQAANQISTGASGITNVTSGTKDGDSVYNGNNDASTYIDKESTYSGQIAGQLTQFVSLVHSMASEFEATDARMSNSIQSKTAIFQQTESGIYSGETLPYTNYFQ